MPQAIDPPLPHRTSALQRTLGASAILHVALVVLLAWSTPMAARRLPVALGAPPPIELEAIDDENDAPRAPSIAKGLEDRAQGEPAAPTDPAIDPASREPEPRPPSAPPKRAEAPPAAPPPEAASGTAASPAPREPAPREPAPREPGTAASPESPPNDPQPPTPARTSMASSASPAMPRPPAPGTSGPPASTGPGPVDSGDGGGFYRPKARDLANAFTHAIPPACDAMAAWRTLPEGDVGRVELELRTDADGRLTGETLLDPPDAPAHFVDVARRTRARLGRGPSALDAEGAGPGTIRLRLSARIEKVPVPEGHEGVPFGLQATFGKGKGEARFTLPEGRRITIDVTVVHMARGPR